MQTRFVPSLISLVFLSLMINGSIFSQESYNMYKIGHWDDPNLPVFSGIRYNDIWGWENQEDGRVYAIMGSSRSTLFIEVTNPQNPQLRDSIAGGHTRCIHRDFKTYKHYAYGVADQGRNSTLQVFDLSTLPDSVRVVYDSNEFFSRTHNIFIDEKAGRLYAVGSNTEYYGVITLDLTQNPEVPTLLSSLELGEYTHDIFVRNDTAWLSNGEFGLAVYDYQDASNPSIIGRLPSYPEQGYNHSSWLSADGKSLVMADETHGKAMKMVNTENIESMSVSSVFKSTLLGPEDEGSIPHNPFIVDNYAIISYYHDGVQVYDISDPENVVNVAYYDTYPNNTDYAGFEGCWGVYPFFNSGMIIASDITSGLYILHTDFPFPDSVTALADISSEPLCAGEETGSIELQASGGGQQYEYTWSNGDSTLMLDSLGTGWYFYTVTDQWGFDFSDSVFISEPEKLSLSFETNDPSCPDSEDGWIIANAEGGTGTLSYFWYSGENSDTLRNISADTYTLEIIDENSCALTESIEISSLNSFPVAEFDFEIIDTDEVCQVVFTNQSNHYDNLQWDLGIYGFTDQEIDTINVDMSFTACLEISNICGSSKECKPINISCVTSILENEAHPWELYPNPSSDAVELSFNHDLPQQLALYDINGRILYQTVPLESKIRIPLESLQSGVYFIKTVSNGKVHTKKIIKN